MGQYQNQKEIEGVVLGFESCSTGKDAFSHRDHLAVATWYLWKCSEEDVLKKMRVGLLRFLEHHGVGTEKYNETITLFWIKVVRGFIDGLDSQLTLTEVTNAVINAFPNSRQVFEYYSEELLQSAAAKSSWVEPDLKVLQDGSVLGFQPASSQTSSSSCRRGVATEVLMARSAAAIKWIPLAILASSVLCKVFMNSLRLN